jgi:hypothetical protein
MTEPGTTALDKLRADILASGHNDFVSMADVQACLCNGLLADLSTGRQHLVVDTVRSLLKDGLVEAGVIPGRNDPGFKPWPGTLDEGTVFNAQIATAVDEDLAGSNYGTILAERGITTVALDETGDIVEHRPEGSSVVLHAKRRAPRGGKPQPTVDG